MSTQNPRWLWLAWLAVGALTVAAVAAASRLQFDDSYREIFRSTDVRYVQYERLVQQFGGGERGLMVLIEAPNCLDRPTLEIIRQLHDRLQDQPQVESVASVFSARGQRRVGRILLPVIPGTDLGDERLAQVQAQLLAHPLVRDRLVSSDRRASLLFVRLRAERPTLEELAASLEPLRKIVDEGVANTNVTARFTGSPAIRVATVRLLQRDHLRILFVGASIATALAWLLLGSLRQVAVVVGPPIIGVIWTLGLMAAVGKNMDVINCVLPPLLLVIGISDSVHLMFHVRRDCTRGEEPWPATLAALKDLIRPCFLTALTTAVGFGSLTVAQDRILSSFGQLSFASIFVIFTATMLVFPLLANLLLRRPQHAIGTQVSWRLPFSLHSLALRLTAAPVRMTIAWILVLIALCFPASAVTPDYSFLESLPDSSEALQALRVCEKKFGGTPALQVTMRWPESEEAYSPKSLALLIAVHQAIEDNPMTSAPTSIVTVLQSLPSADDELQDRVKNLRYLPADAVRRFIDIPERCALVSASVPDAGAAALRKPLDNLQQRLTELERANPGFSIEMSGLAVLATFRTVPMIQDLSNSLLLDAVVILIIMLIAFRSPLLGIASMIPNIFPLLATAACMVWLGFKLQYATAMAFSLCLGIATDDTIHFIHRFHRELGSGACAREAAARAFHINGPAVLVTTVLLVTGFAAGITSSMPTIRAFGIFSCVALAFSLVGEVLMLPAILVVCAPRRSGSKTTTPTNPTNEDKGETVGTLESAL
jgi:predicted RND superfamily exporter protein